MAGGDRRLHLVRLRLRASQRGVEQLDSLVDRVPVPARAVLLLERDEVAVFVDTTRAARVVEEHEREQRQRLGLVRHELRQGTGEANGFVREALTHEVGARARGVALVEEQVQDRQYRPGSLGE